jgi:hypothetical protein
LLKHEGKARAFPSCFLVVADLARRDFYGLRLRVLGPLRLAAGFFVRAGVFDGFASVAALFVGCVGAGTAGGCCAGAGVALVVVAFVAAFVAGVVSPVSVVAGASEGSVAPPMPTHAYQPPSSGRTFVKP